MIMYIKNILIIYNRNSEIIIDCSWHHYLFKLPDVIQPSD